MPRRRCYKPTANQYSAFIKESVSAVFFTPSIPKEYQILTELITTNIYTFYTEYETYILNIIQFIIDKISLDTVLKEIQILQAAIKTTVQAEAVLHKIEIILLSVVDNIAAGVDIKLIINRITYLKTQLALATDLPVIYNDITDLIAYVMEQITNKESLDIVLSNLLTIKTAMAGEVQIAQEIIHIQNIIITIIENVIEGIDMSFIIGRITYLQGLIKVQFGYS
jgi:hypothetical protein